MLKTDTQSKTILTAKNFIEKLYKLRSDAELKKYERFFKFSKEKPLKNDDFIGVRMGHVFALAKEFIDMPLKEIEKLMEHKVHEVRAGAMSIMGQKAKNKKTTQEELKALYELYIRRHDRINSWDLVDLAAYYVVGPYLLDKPRSVLYKLARSKNQWERRTAILSTWAFTRTGDTDDVFKIASILVKDKEEFVQTGIGWMLRASGGPAKPKLIQFLNKHAKDMSRIALRASIEKFSEKERKHFLSL